MPEAPAPACDLQDASDLKLALDLCAEAMPDRVRPNGPAVDEEDAGFGYWLGEGKEVRYVYVYTRPQDDYDTDRDACLGWAFAEAARRGWRLSVEGGEGRAVARVWVPRPALSAPPRSPGADRVGLPAHRHALPSVAALLALAAAVAAPAHAS